MCICIYTYMYTMCMYIIYIYIYTYIHRRIKDGHVPRALGPCGHFLLETWVAEEREPVSEANPCQGALAALMTVQLAPIAGT